MIVRLMPDGNINMRLFKDFFSEWDKFPPICELMIVEGENGTDSEARID